MFKRTSLTLLVVGLLILAIAPSFALIKWSRVGGGQQIWLTADSFSARSTVGGSPNFATAADSKGCIGGAKAFMFDGSPAWMNGLSPDMTAFDMAYWNNWWVEYQIPLSAIPADFILDEEMWKVSGRVSGRFLTGDLPADYQFDCDVLIANGDPNDFDLAAPTEADWTAAAFAKMPGMGNPDVCFNSCQMTFDNFGPNVNNHWAWRADQPLGDVLIKTFKVYDGKVTFRLYPREYGHWNPRIDVLELQPLGDSYSPGPINSDQDFQMANTGSGATGFFACMVWPIFAGQVGDGEYWKSPITVEFTNATTGKVVYTEVCKVSRQDWGTPGIYLLAGTPDNGTTMLIPAGTYDVRISTSSSLKKKFSGVVIPSGGAGVPDPFVPETLINGDLTGDNKVNILDIVPIKTYFNVNGQ
jgi:hypothetical protein